MFYTAMSLAFAASVFVGFAPTYFLKGYFGGPPLSPLVHLHGLIFTGWILLFLTQTALVAGRRIDLHRRLGAAGVVLAGLIPILGLTTAIASGRRNFAANPVEALTFLVLPFGDVLVFLTLAAAGIYYRRRPETHKRLMLLATIGILDAAVARWPLEVIQTSSFAFFLLTDLFLLPGVIYDLVSRRRIHPAYIRGGLLILISQPLRMAIANTSLWLAFAGLFVP
jgi:uncharacterized membrane protein